MSHADVTMVKDYLKNKVDRNRKETMLLLMLSNKAMHIDDLSSLFERNPDMMLQFNNVLKEINE